MKTLTFYCFLFLILSPDFSYAQTAEEILSRTEEVYLNLDNYVDEGIHTTIYLNGRGKGNLNYVLAMDKSKNVYHRVTRLADNREEYGYEYSKSALNNTGTFRRLFGDKIETENYELNQACGGLAGVGGGILMLFASLTYENLFEDSWEKGSLIHNYDRIFLEKDTVINQNECYVLVTDKQRMVTKEMIERSNAYADSVASANYRHFEPRPVEPYQTSQRKRLYIRKSDFLILKIEFTFQINTDDSSTAILTANPRINVPNFDDYFKG